MNLARWELVGDGSAGSGVPTAEIGGGQLALALESPNSGSLQDRTAQIYGRLEARLQGSGSLALVDRTTSATIVSIPVVGSGSQTLVIEWTPSQLTLRRDGQVVQTITESGDDLVPDRALAAAVIVEGGPGATLSVDRVTIDRLAPCGGSGPAQER